MTTQRYARLLAVAGIATTLGVLAACNGDSNDVIAVSPTPSDNLGAPTVVGAPPIGQMPTIQQVEATQAAVADLMRQKAFAQGDVALFSAERVEWPDTSLGNPQPGKAYAQMVTPRLAYLPGGEGAEVRVSHQSRREVTDAGR
ncbi:MAG: hypothetical protein HY261_07930 [Chloroflexi bacterium]|nr:hypothetical protein [Chloroflexota bacterium]